jgi:excisionase family DNA binding protein
MITDPILKIADVAQLLKVAQKTIYALAQRREIPAFKVGGQWRFSKAALDNWIAARCKASLEREEAHEPEDDGEGSLPGRRRRR